MSNAAHATGAPGYPLSLVENHPTAIQAIAAVMRDVEAVGKGQYNQGQKFKFRGIDDLMNAVAGPLRKHGVVIVPTVTERVSEVRGKMTAVWLTVKFRFYGPDGNYIEAVTMGEAADSFDKATNKAMSAALKYALLQVLMIPVDGSFIEDGDRHSPEGVRNPEPSASDVDELFAAIKNAWNDRAALGVIHQQAEQRGALNLTGNGPDGQPIAAGQLIQRRARQLLDAENAAAQEAQRAKAAPASQWESGAPDAEDLAAAQAELYDAARTARMALGEMERQFAESYGHSVAEATPAELRQMRDLLLDGVA